MKTLYACIFISMLGHHSASAQIGPADSYYVGRVKDIFPGTESSQPRNNSSHFNLSEKYLEKNRAILS
jgi:hypothetical protein